MKALMRPGTWLVVLLALVQPGWASDRATIFDLKLGAAAAQLLPASRFEDLTCGSDGGPAMQAVTDWSDFARCPPDRNGLHEISFRYDDEDELQARARDDIAAGWALGTSFDYFPIIPSALFDDHGTLVGLRLVSDPRYDPMHETFLHLRPRQEHYLLGLYLMDRFRMAQSDCHDLVPDPGETPVFGMFEKRSCAAVHEGISYAIETRLLRRQGESDVDPVMGVLTEGQYLSLTRAEVRVVSPE